MSNPYDATEIATCETLVTVDAPVSCGVASGAVYYTSNAPALSDLCVDGDGSEVLVYDSINNIWTWTCTSAFGLDVQSCTAEEYFCGDGRSGV